MGTNERSLRRGALFPLIRAEDRASLQPQHPVLCSASSISVAVCVIRSKFDAMSIVLWEEQRDSSPSGVSLFRTGVRFTFLVITSVALFEIVRSDVIVMIILLITFITLYTFNAKVLNICNAISLSTDI